jgi:hypothetical protein
MSDSSHQDQQVVDAAVVSRLLAGVDDYDRRWPYYDDVFVDVHRRVAAAGEADKTAIAALTFWKRSGQGAWAAKLLNQPDEEVRKVTRAAFAAATDQQALDELAVLPGFTTKRAIPTALLCAFDPERFAVMDRRAHVGLARIAAGVGTQRGRTIRYLERARNLRDLMRADRPSTSCRDVDKALYVLGG